MKNNVVIEGLEKKKTKYNVITNIGEFKIDEDTIVKYFVFKDKVFTKAEFDNIISSYDLNIAMNKAINYLSFKSRTINEIRTYLKDFASAEIVLEKLISAGYLNDDAYSKYYLEYCKRNLKGPLVFEKKLIEKGVYKDLINKYLMDYSEEEELDLILNLVNKFVIKNSSKPIKALKLSLLSKLLRDGFHQEIIYQVINNYKFEDNSDESLISDYEKQVAKYQNKEISEFEKKQKITNYLLNKGYEYIKIKGLL